MENREEYTAFRVTEDPTRNNSISNRRQDTDKNGLLQKVIIGLVFVIAIFLIVGITMYVNKSTKGDKSPDPVKPSVIYEGNNPKTLDPDPEFQQPETQADSNACDTLECQKASRRIKKSLNSEVDPCVDFYEFACGGFIETQKEILARENKNSTTQLDILSDELTTNVIEILEEGEKLDDSEGLKQAKLFYNACTASTNNGKRSSENAELKKFIKDLFLDIDSVSSTASPEFAKLLGRIRREMGGELTVSSKPYIGGNYLFSIGAEFDLKDLASGMKSPVYKLQLRPAVLSARMIGLPDFYLLIPTLEELTKKSIATSWMALYGEESVWPATDAMKVANQTVELEITLIIAGTPPKNYIEKFINVYKLLSLNDLALLTQYDFDWTAFFRELYAGTNVNLDLRTLKVSVLEVQYFQRLMRMLKLFSMTEIKNYLKWRIIFDLAGANSDIRDALKASEVLTYSEPSPTVCAIKTKQYFTSPLIYPYLSAHFDDKSKYQVEVMVNDLKNAFQDLLDEATWLTYLDVLEAKKKINKMRSNLAYPPNSMDKAGPKNKFAELRIKPENSFLRNFLEGIRFDSIHRLQKLGEAKTYGEWQVSPIEINAAYEPLYNTITFPAAILQPPLYGNPKEYQNFGAMGSIIGHEITHGFDSRGRRFDEDGAFKAWGDPDTTTNFNYKSRCFVSQYNQYREPECSVNLDGNKTMNENIADNGGVRQAFKAYQSYIKREGSESTLAGLIYTPDQMFFISFAQAFCEVPDTSSCVTNVLTDEHSPGRFRVKGALENFDEFHRAWKCPVPSSYNTCRVW